MFSFILLSVVLAGPCCAAIRCNCTSGSTPEEIACRTLRCRDKCTAMSLSSGRIARGCAFHASHTFFLCLDPAFDPNPDTLCCDSGDYCNADLLPPTLAPRECAMSVMPLRWEKLADTSQCLVEVSYYCARNQKALRVFTLNFYRPVESTCTGV